VGLVQREVERAGIATVSLSTLPDFTRSVGAPRVAGIAYPMGRPLGAPGDAGGQRAVLLAALRLVEEAAAPGEVVRLPFDWPEPLRRAQWHPREPPPIARLLRRRPWLLPRLVGGDIP
jgi:D-proline reductase (dithiol) PrdB